MLSPKNHNFNIEHQLTDKHRENSRIICGNSNPILARDIANLLSIRLVNCELEYFSNTEIRPVIKESIRRKHIYIIQTGTFNKLKYHRSINDHLMETYLLARTCKRSDAKSITLIMPCYPYSRQDKKDNPRGCISARDVADMLEVSGINRIVCLDLHCPQIQGFFRISCDNLYCNNLIKNFLFQNVFSRIDDYKDKHIVIAPDEGALPKARSFANQSNLPYMVLCKRRDYTKLNQIEDMVLIGNPELLKDKTAIIIDDMCDTFGTVQKATNCLMENGAKDVILAVTHGIFSGPAIDRMNKTEAVKMVICSDSIPQLLNQQNCKKLKVFSVSNIFAKTIENLITGKSISRIFDTTIL